MKILINSVVMTFFIAVMLGCSSGVAMDHEENQESISSSETSSFVTLSPEDIPALTVQPSASPTETSISHKIQATEALESIDGELLVIDSIGIVKLSFSQDQPEYLLRKGDDWLWWKAAFSNDGDFLAYLFQTEDGYELWLTDSRLWLPELAISIESKHEVASLEWLVNDKYLLMRLGSLEEDNVGQKIRIDESYIVNPRSGLIESPEDWSGSCNILAFSPRTGNLATWCIDEGTNQENIVIEIDGELWTTDQEPSEILKELAFEGETSWAWSYDEDYIGFTKFDRGESLYYSPTDKDMPILLAGTDSGPFGFLSWSPNSEYLMYFGKCEDGNFCHIISQVENKEVLWTSQTNTLTNVGPVAWSPNSDFIAISTPNSIVIVNLSSRQKVFEINNISVIDLKWISQMN